MGNVTVERVRGAAGSSSAHSASIERIDADDTIAAEREHREQRLPPGPADVRRTSARAILERAEKPDCQLGGHAFGGSEPRTPTLRVKTGWQCAGLRLAFAWH